MGTTDITVSDLIHWVILKLTCNTSCSHYSYILLSLLCGFINRKIHTANIRHEFLQSFIYEFIGQTSPVISYSLVDEASILAFSTDLKRIQTPHRLFWDFGTDKTLTTRWSGDTALAEFKFKSKFNPACHDVSCGFWQSLPKAIDYKRL